VILSLLFHATWPRFPYTTLFRSNGWSLHVHDARGGQMIGTAIVAGGGIGGLATAIALERIGWRVTVLEQATEFAEIGAGLSIWQIGRHTSELQSRENLVCRLLLE